MGEAKHVHNLVKLPLKLYAGQEDQVEVASIAALLREVDSLMFTVNDELAYAVNELKLREAEATQVKS